MSLGQEQSEFTVDVIALLQTAIEMGYEVRLGEVLRPLEMQQIYVNTGRSRTLNSQHIKKLAIDLILLKDGKVCSAEQIKPLGDWWQLRNPKNRWGGSWRGLIESGKSTFVDAPHFERMA